MGLFLSFILCLLIIDYLVIGLIPMAIGIWPKCKKYIRKNDILFKTPIYTVSTNIDHNLYFRHTQYRTNFLNLLVSNRYVLIKNSFLTCLPPIETKAIGSYKIKRGFLGKRTILLLQDGKKIYLSFWIKNNDGFISILKHLGIQEQIS